MKLPYIALAASLIFGASVTYASDTIDLSTMEDTMLSSMKDEASDAVQTVEDETSSDDMSVDDMLELESELEEETVDTEAESSVINSLYEAAKEEVQNFPAD